MKYRIYDVRILTGDPSRVIDQGAIIFDQSGILGIGNPDITSDVDVEINGAGMTVLPGLIDAHVHLGMDCSPDPFQQIQLDREADTAFKAYRQGIQFLQSGITTIRNLGTKNHVDIAFRQSMEQGIATGPRVFAAGQPIVITGGHGYPMATEADGVEEIRKATRHQIKIGADVIKLMATGGVLTAGTDPGSPQLTLEELRCACEEACRASKTTAAHAIGLEGVKNAIKAGITTIEHGYILDDEAIEMMIERGTFLVPTLLAPLLILEQGRSVPRHMIEKLQKIEEEHRSSFRKALKAGVKIAVGTDAGTPFNMPGLIVNEMELMLKEGMSALDVIHSATRMGAECLHIGERTGSLDLGKWADIILVEGNPLNDWSSLKRIRQVFKGGQPLFP
ncbi:metal-dependent hydrolase family protein [Paludifilum halophilum]|uniref:Amidohydrolase n=1 Tax=Paludifilum halophilum TaxID=1642702 RepID=A0A235B825_9BACL|nr:amidohydrolase family protein [Paludifilum halophilum]OYD08139.1 amidohydrolase [Paludifilum halophilum]